MSRFVIKSGSGSYMLNKGIGVTDIKKAKVFKTRESAKNYVEEIRNQAEWMKDFKCEIIELEEKYE